MSTIDVIESEHVHELVQCEFHHRFYNSLQLVASATRMLAQPALDEEARMPMLRDLHERVDLLARMHKLLAEPLDEEGDVTCCFERLCRMVAGAFDRDGASIELAITPPPMPPTVARGMMLLMVELVTNAFKHGATPMRLRVEIDGPFPGLCMMTVRNSAPSGGCAQMPVPLIANRLARSLGGVLNLDCGVFVEATAIVPVERPCLPASAAGGL